MLNFDIDAFEERAAIIEFDGGLSRFEAETLAAQAQGVSRWQALEIIRCNQQGTSSTDTASASGGTQATSGQPARSAATVERNQRINVSASASSQTASSGIAGTAE